MPIPATSDRAQADHGLLKLVVPDPDPAIQPRASRPGRAAVAAWTACIAALAGFILFARVTVEAGWFPGLRSDRVLAIWADFGDRLSGSTTTLGPLAIALYAALALFLLLSAAGLWLALTAHPPAASDPFVPAPAQDRGAEP